jgi:hypothetical protein
MQIVDGALFKAGHATANAFEAAGMEKPARDYSRLSARPQTVQKPVCDLPLFDTESRRSEQLTLF